MIWSQNASLSLALGKTGTDPPHAAFLYSHSSVLINCVIILKSINHTLILPFMKHYPAYHEYRYSVRFHY